MSDQPTFKSYGVKPRCYGCGRKLKATEVKMFRSLPKRPFGSRAVYGACCMERV